MMNSTQQNDANGGTPLAEPTGSDDEWVECWNCGGGCSASPFVTAHTRRQATREWLPVAVDYHWMDTGDRILRWADITDYAACEIGDHTPRNHILRLPDTDRFVHGYQSLLYGSEERMGQSVYTADWVCDVPVGSMAEVVIGAREETKS